jgi:hypothetical protein
MNATETRRFLVTTPGLCATRWLSFVLASRPDVYVAHGKHSLESIAYGQFKTERQQGDKASLALGNVMGEFYRRRSLTDVFEIYHDFMPSAVAIGNVHTYTLSEVLNRFGPLDRIDGCDRETLRLANVIRHPISYIQSHTAMVRSAADHPPLRKHFRCLFAEALELRPELLDIPCQAGPDIEAFVVSCFSASRFLDDLRCDEVQHLRMEDLTSDVNRLTEFCEYVTQLPYDRGLLSGFINEGPINRHHKTAGRATPHDIYAQWQPWQRHVAALLLPDELIERFAGARYDVSMLQGEDRQALALARAMDSTSSGRLGDMVNRPSDQAPSDGWPVVPPALVDKGYCGFNIVRFRQRHFGLEQSLGQVDLAAVDDAWLDASREANQIIIGGTLVDVRQQIDQLMIDRNAAESNRSEPDDGAICASDILLIQRWAA